MCIFGYIFENILIFFFKVKRLFTEISEKQPWKWISLYLFSNLFYLSEEELIKLKDKSKHARTKPSRAHLDMRFLHLSSYSNM